jgi:hypothetical protein
MLVLKSQWQITMKKENYSSPFTKENKERRNEYEIFTNTMFVIRTKKTLLI